MSDDPWAAPAPAEVRRYGSASPAAARTGEAVVTGRDAAAFVVTVVGLVLAGPLLGLLWAAVAPRVHLTIVATAQLPRDVDYDAYSKGFIGADAYFLGVAVLAGLLTGALAWRWGRHGGPGVVAGLAAGGILGALVARAVGQRVYPRSHVQRAVLHDPVGTHLYLWLQLRAEPVLVAWALVAVTTYLVLLRPWSSPVRPAAGVS